MPIIAPCRPRGDWSGRRKGEREREEEKEGASKDEGERMREGERR